ncbi:hypothetical protein J3R03_009499 [Actinoplanes couchii]|nr:hypothetical protein [Actinoplanes couchii]
MPALTPSAAAHARAHLARGGFARALPRPRPTSARAHLARAHPIRGGFARAHFARGGFARALPRPRLTSPAPFLARAHLARVGWLAGQRWLLRGGDPLCAVSARPGCPGVGVAGSAGVAALRTPPAERWLSISAAAAGSEITPSLSVLITLRCATIRQRKRVNRDRPLRSVPESRLKASRSEFRDHFVDPAKRTVIALAHCGMRTQGECPETARRPVPTGPGRKCCVGD